MTWFTNLVSFFIGVGLVWAWAWVVKPDIDSGTVWILAFIFASLSNQIEASR